MRLLGHPLNRYIPLKFYKKHLTLTLRHSLYCTYREVTVCSR